MKKTRIFSLIALVLAMLMVFAACAPAATDTKSNDSEQTTPADTQQTEEPAKTDEPAAQTPAEPVTITYCNFNSSGGNEETLQKMVEAFEATHENIKIEVETIGYDDYFTQMQTRVAGGTAPDCYELNIENFAAYANKGLLAEITGQDLSGLNETALGAFNVNGKQYGLPESFSNVVLIYNKDLFDQAGVTYPTDDWTQDDVQNAAEKIRALGDDIFGIWQPITYNEFFKVVAQYGGSLLNEDKTQFTINSEENIKAAQTLVDRVLVSNVQPNSVQQGGMGDWDMFMSGRLGMIPTGIWAFQTFTENCDFAWDIAVEPGSTQKATHFFSNCVVMNPETEHPEEVAEWLAWLTSSTESADIRLAAGWDLPALKDLNALSSYLEITPPDNRKAVFESLDYLVMPPVIEDYALMSDIIGQYLSAAADGTMTVTDALNAAQADCEAQITLGYIVLYLPLMMAVSLAVASLLSQQRRSVGVFRVLYYIPVLTSWVAASLIWKSILAPQYGAMNNILAFFGIEGPGWLLDEKWAMPAIVLVSVWKDVGFFGLILLSGMVGINRTYYEAAEIDGAGAWTRFWKITLPLLTPAIFYVLIVSLINSFQLFPQIMIMTDGGPNGATQVMVERIYKYGFRYFKMGYASAFSWILFLIIMVCTAIQMRGQKRWVNYDA